jgi:hypothetical protein
MVRYKRERHIQITVLGYGSCPDFFVSIEGADKVGEDVTRAVWVVGEAEVDEGVFGVAGLQGVTL